MNDIINKGKKNNKIKLCFSPKEDLLTDFLQNLNSFGKIYLKSFNFKECPKIFRIIELMLYMEKIKIY